MGSRQILAQSPKFVGHGRADSRRGGNRNKPRRKWFVHLPAARFCKQAFQPSPRRPDQAVCSRPECQAQRRNDYRRRKSQTDPEYAEVVRDSRRKWREAHPDYQKNYRVNHPEVEARNRQQQRQRDQKRRIGLLVKNTLVVDLKRSAAGIWLVGPLAADLEKNTLVSSRLLILQAPAATIPPAVPS
jgi:hypothetical protein